MGGLAWHRHQQTTNQHLRLMARSDPANAPRALTPVPMMLHTTQHTLARGTPPSQPYTALPWWDGRRSQPPYPYRHTTATFSIIPTHIHTPIGVQSPAPATSPHPTWLQGTNGHHAPNDTLDSCTPPIAHILNPYTGKRPSPEHQAPAALSLPPLTHTDSLIGPATATAAALTNTRAHAHLYHHLHSRFAYPSQGHPPCRHIHQLLPLLGLPSSTTTPPSQSQSQTYPLAAQQQHWPWELRVLAKPTPGPAHVGKCGCCCCAGSPQPPWNDDVRGSFFFKF